MARVINLPFNQWSESRIEAGVKRATTRRGRKGFPGDMFVLNGKRYELTSVKRVTLATVKTECWQIEGCDNAKHFEKIWIGLHKRLGFVPHMKVWLHMFKPVKGAYV